MATVRIGQWAIVLSAGCAALFVGAAEAKDGAGGNLLADPSFSAARLEAPDGWRPRAWAGEAACRFGVETPGRAGGRCVSIASEAGADAAWTVTVAVEPETWYRLSGWIRTERLRGATGALLNIQNLQAVRTPPVRGTRGWTRVAVDFRTGAERELEINCLFGGWGSSAGRAWYDDIALERRATMDGQPCAEVSVAREATLTPYGRRVFGGFLEHFEGQVYGGVYDPGSPLADAEGYRTDVIEALRALRLAVVRWPGGCFASGYHWRDGVGPDRRPVPDPVWGVVDRNTFGTDEFVEWCRRVGCEPYLCTNAGNGTAEEMRDWVAYCNRDGGPHVGIWSIGNENWGAHEIGARTPAEWGPLVRHAADLMRAADPSIELIAAATPDRDWTLPLLRAAGERLDQVAVHAYWLPLWGENATPDYLTCLASADDPDRLLDRVLDVLDEAGCRGRVKIAFDEWNLRGWHHPGFPRKEVGDPTDPATAALIAARARNAIASQYTMADAVFSAGFLNASLRHAADIGMTNIAPIVNTRGPLFVHEGGLVKRTTYHVLWMYANLLEESVAEAGLVTTPLGGAAGSAQTVDALVTCDVARRRWRIALINRHPSASVPCSLDLNGRRLEGEYRTTVLAGDSPDAYNTIEQPERVRPEIVTLPFAEGRTLLPPHSISIVEISE